jgi:hypothetical protein
LLQPPSSADENVKGAVEDVVEDAVGAAGCIVGRALYEGSLTLASAATAAGELAATAAGQ